jgi:hypothetical protein
MKSLKIAGVGMLVAGSLSVATLVSASPASAHRDSCHTHHVCPSDHATYRWKGRLCVKPSSEKNDGTFRKKVRYAGLPYLCK